MDRGSGTFRTRDTWKPVTIWRRHMGIITALVITGVLVFSCMALRDRGGPDEQLPTVLITRVVDGDTAHSDMFDEPIRIISVQCPEKGEEFYEEAMTFTRDLIEGKEVTVERDERRYGPYGRPLGYLWVDGVFVNEAIIRAGWGRVEIYKPNIRYAQIFFEAQREAQAEGRGIWQ